MRYNKYLTIFLFQCFLFLSCKKFVSIELPSALLKNENVFSDVNSANSAVIGLYNQMTLLNLSLTNGGMSVFGSLSADDLYSTSLTASSAPFSENSLLPDNNIVNANFWSLSYRVIYHANLILEGLTNSSLLNDLEKNRLTGEVLTIRAFHYFYLVNLFGDVPLITSTDFRVNSIMPRTPSDLVYNQIVDDLINANKYFLSDENERGRASMWVTNALLARVYLYLEDWEKAAKYSTIVLDAGVFSLEQNLNNVFIRGSKETIWHLQIDLINSAEGRSFIPLSSTRIPAYALTNSLLDAFEIDDARKIIWLNKNTISGNQYFYPFKYKVRSDPNVTEFSIILRLAEQYLIRAEARGWLNDLEGALKDINVLRNRTGLPDANASSVEQLQLLVEKERQVELFAEWGHRWFDLKRKNKADVVLSIQKPISWQSTDQFYPIPQQSLDTNPYLLQNPGY